MPVACCKTGGTAVPRWVRPQRHYGADGWMGKLTPVINNFYKKKNLQRGWAPLEVLFGLDNIQAQDTPFNPTQ